MTELTCTFIALDGTVFQDTIHDPFDLGLPDKIKFPDRQGQFTKTKSDTGVYFYVEVSEPKPGIGGITLEKLDRAYNEIMKGGKFRK